MSKSMLNVQLRSLLRPAQLSVLLLVLTLQADLALAAPPPPYPPPPNGTTCNPCNSGVFNGQMTVYCCQNLFASSTAPVTCSDGQGPWADQGSCKVPVFSYSPPPLASPPPASKLPPPPFPPPPTPPPTCPGECSKAINATYSGKTETLYCCGPYYMLINGCLVCTSTDGYGDGPFYDSSCSLVGVLF